LSWKLAKPVVTEGEARKEMVEEMQKAQTWGAIRQAHFTRRKRLREERRVA